MANRKKDIIIKLDDFISAANLEENWGFKVLRAEQVRAIVKVETNEGTFALKKVDHKPEKINFIYEAQEHLWKNGFRNQPRWLVTKSGQSFVPAGDGHFYFLNTWINGKESTVTNPDQIKEIMRLQATLHQCSLGFTPSPNAKIKTKWGQWDKKYESDIGKLKKFYNEVKLQPDTALVSAFHDTAEGIIKMAEAGKELFNTSAYTEVLNRAIDAKGFVHGDLAYHNLICSNDGKMNVIDFDYCSQNLRINDLARFLRKVMRRADWDTDLNLFILQAYHEVYPLCDDELEILKAMMHLSKRYLRAFKRGFITKRYTPGKAIDCLYEEADALDKRKKYLDSFPTKL
jgi:CotS family spore coat protein